MNKELEQLYAQYSQVNDISRDVFLNSYEQFGDTYINFIQEALKKKENSQETPSNSSGLGENQPTPISAQGNPQITSVPISQDLDLNQAQVEAMQGVQNIASLNLELPQQSVNQNGLLESNGEVNTSSSVLEDSFNNFIQEGGQLPLNPTSTRLNVLPRAYEDQFKNVTESTTQVSESENINTTNNDFVDFGNGITLPKELLPEEKTKEQFNKEIAESAKDVTLKQSGKLELFDIENPKWRSRNIGDLQGEDYVNAILQKEKEGKVKVARNEKGELIDEYLKPILDKSNILWQPIGSYINVYNNIVIEFNKKIELNNQKVSQNNALIESQNIRDLFLGKKEEPKSPLTTLYNKIYSDTGILLTEEQKAQFNTIDDVYNFYASEKAKKEVQKNPNLNYNEEYSKLLNELNPKISTQQSLQLGKNFVNNFLLGFRIEEEKSFNEARGYGAKIDPSYQKGYNSKDDLQEINFINNLSNNDYGLGLIGEWWNAVGKKEIGTTNYKINATLSTPEGRADVINSIANYINGIGSIQKELAYENIQREKFNNLKNAKEGNALALQNSINFIQSESNKINQIDKQQKEIYDFIDSWKKTQIRNNKKEQEFSRTYSGYQNGEILPSIKVIAGNTVNGISDAFKSTVAGVAQLPNLVIGSDEYNDVISEIKKPSDFFGVKTSGMFSKYYDYKSGGKDIRFQNGNYYELINGDYRTINLTYAQISNLGKAKEGEEFSIAGMIGDTTRMATEIALAEFTGAVELKGLSKFSQLRNIERASSVFGEESALTNSLQRLERFSKNPTNNGYFGWFTQTIADNYQEAKAKGMTNTQASVYGSVQSLLTSFLSRINPDVKFFKTYKEIDEKLIGSLLKNDKQGFLNNLKSLSNHVGGEISSETGQELTEQFAQELVRQFYNTSLTDKKFDTMTADDVLKTVITTAITTGALTSSNLALRGSGDNIVNYDNAYYNSTQLSEGQKLVMLANLNTSEIFKNFNNQFISDKNKLNEIEQTVKSVKTYLDKIPNKDKYTLNTQTKAVSLLYEIDQKRKQLNKADESFKDDINAEINGLSNELKQLLNDDLKLQNEQPQQTTQPEQTQETTQGQTAETNLQPKQTTVAGEQGISIDLNAKTGDILYKTENTNQNIQDNGKKDTRTTVQEQGSGEKMLGNEQRSQENGQNTDLGLSSMGEQNQEQKQTTQQVEEVATNITEEEQEKINLERLYAYIEAKKQREQEQQVQVSPIEEVENVQQNETFSVNEQPQTIEQPSETQNAPLVKDLSYFENLAKDYQSFDDFYNDVSKMTDISPEVSNEFRDKYKNENNDTAKNALLNLYNAQKNTQQQEQKVETPKVELQPNQTQIADNVIATIDNITLPDGENGFKVTVSDLQGNLIEDKNGDYEFEFNTQDEVDKFVSQKEKGYKLSKNRPTVEKATQVSPSPQYEGAVTYTQFGEGQEGTIYYENGVAKIKDKAGKVYNANSPLVKNLKDAEGNAIQLQKGNQRLTTITKEAFDALIAKLQKAFPRFAKVTYDLEAFKKQAEKLGATFNDIQRMVMALHGSPHSFPKEILVENELGEREYLVGDSDSFPEVPKGYKVIEKFPFGRFRLDKIGTGEGSQAFGWGLYFTDLESIAREYANKLTEPSFYVNGILQGENFKNNYPDLYNVGIELFGAKSKEDAINKVTNSAILSEKEKRRAIEVLSGIDSFKSEKNNRNLYKVSLHKGKTPEQYTWLEWDKPVSENILSKLRESLDYPMWTKVKPENGQQVYKDLSSWIGSDKEASLFLLENGIDGVKYPAESISRGATSDNARGFNYVVFDENAVTIEDKIQFMQTPNGTIYGAKLPDGTIYLNPEFLNANTPIHEFSHLFEQLLPSRFKKGVELLKQTNLGKNLFEQLKQEGNYANLTDEQLWGEALNTHIGNFGENEVNNPKGKLKQLQDWIKDFFAKVGDVLGIKKLSPDTQLRMFTEGVVKDLLGGKPIVAENQVSPSEQVQYSFLTENDYDTNGNIKPEVLAEIQAERESIKAEAQANGTFMKAPNGKSTNLNEAQWIDVRTKRFKDWFGDWENDPENSSKVVDENGEPLVVYHGTKDNFNEFDSKKQSNKGFWFTPKKNLADGYSMARNSGEIGNVFSVFLNIKNPANNDWVSKSNPNSEIITNDMVSFDELGYDGWISVIGGKTTSLVALNPNQIKSATANVGTYSASSNDIRYSINSTTPLSVKEQTEVINELVANGEESAFAKLQETNWYKGLSDNQKQSINLSNIAETVINAVNANKRNLEQKLERREEKIESIKDRNYWRKQALNSIKLILNDKTINDKITPNEINRLIKLSEKLNTVKDIDKYFDEFGEKVDKIIEDAEKRLSTKEKLQAQKEELKAKEEEKIDAIKSVKEVIQQTINDASERGLFKGITSSKVLEYAMRNINKAITPSQQKRVLNTVKKIINDNEYLNKARQANDLAKRVKKLANSKSISKPLVNIDTAKQFAKINPRNVENIDDYIELANAIIGNLKGISVNNKLEVSNKNYSTNNESILKYIEDTLKYNEKVKEEELKADYDELLRTSTLPVKDMSFEEYKDFINLSKLEENAQKFENNSKATQEERTNLLRATVNRRLKNDFETEILANKSEYSSEEQKIINRISKIDTSKLDYKQLVKLNDVINNAIYNNSFMDAGNISLIAQVQENEKAIDDFKVKNNFNFLSLSDNWVTTALQGAISNDMLVEFITNSTTASAFLKIKSGISAVMDGHAEAKIIQQKTVNAFINMKKKVGWKSDTTENRNIRGIYAEMLRNNGGTVEEIQSEWDRKKGLIEQTIDGLANSRNKEDNKASELLQKVYDKTLKDANNISELEANISKLEFGKFNIDSVKFWIEQHDKYADDFIEQGNIYNNKNLEKELNYTGRKYRPITEDAKKKQDDTLFNEVYRSTEISYKESGSKTKTVKNKFLPKGLVLDLDFDKVQAKMLYDNLYDLKTAEGISLLKNFLSNPENIDRIGGTRNMEALKNMMRNTILAQKQALPFENDNFAKALDKIAGSVMMKSARLALGSVTQLPKQYLSVLVNTSVNLGADIPLLFEAYRVSGFRNNLELFDKFNIGLRGTTIAGYNKENAIFADENAGTVDKTKAILYDVNKASKALYDGTMKALELSDVSIARTTWLAFYMKSLKKQGIDITKIDWSKEHENPNQEAAAFAEQTVSRLQNANDASSMADNFKNTNTYAKVFKNLYMPYSTFAVNQRARMTSDMQKIIHGSIDGRAEAFKSLIATIAEQAVFNSFKIYVLANGAQYLAELFLTGILGWDDEEAEDLFKNAKKYATQKFVTSTISDILFSGMGGGAQTGLQFFANKLTKLINGEEYFYEYKNDPEKTGIPNSISGLGGYAPSIATFLGLANDMKYLDGEGEEIVKGGGTKNVVMRPKELSKESKQLVYLTFMVDALALAGLGDQYISQINQKIKKARDKKIKDDLGSYFDTRIYIPSSSDNYKNYAKLRIDKKTSISDIKQMAKKEGAYLNEKTFSRKMKDEIFNYKVSKHRDEIEDKLLNYREGKINRDQLRNYVKSLKDLSYDQQVKLWKTFPKDNKK